MSKAEEWGETILGWLCLVGFFVAAFFVARFLWFEFLTSPEKQYEKGHYQAILRGYDKGEKTENHNFGWIGLAYVELGETQKAEWYFQKAAEACENVLNKYGMANARIYQEKDYWIYCEPYFQGDMNYKETTIDWIAQAGSLSSNESYVKVPCKITEKNGNVFTLWGGGDREIFDCRCVSSLSTQITDLALSGKAFYACGYISRSNGFNYLTIEKITFE